jgi:hypothetical protein
MTNKSVNLACQIKRLKTDVRFFCMSKFAGWNSEILLNNLIESVRLSDESDLAVFISE